MLERLSRTVPRGESDQDLFRCCVKHQVMLETYDIRKAVCRCMGEASSLDAATFGQKCVHGGMLLGDLGVVFLVRLTSNDGKISQ